MARIWKETLSPKYMHDTFGIYHGIWMPQMDRCWMSNDGYQVTSRILITDWGKVEHVAITHNAKRDFFGGLFFCGGTDFWTSICSRMILSERVTI